MPAHPFDSAYSLLRNAERKWREAGEAIRELISAPGYVERFVEKVNASNVLHHGFRFGYPIPERITFAVRDSIHDLRAALDHIGFACARAADATVTRNAAFPFSAKKTDFQNNRSGGSRNVPPQILDHFMACKGYGDEDGNHLLYAINNIRNVNDHRILQQMAHNFTFVEIETNFTNEMFQKLFDSGVREVMSFEPVFVFPPIWNPDKRELVIAKTDSRIEQPIKIQAEFFISFGNIDFIGLQDPLAVIRQMLLLVAGIVRSTRSKAVEVGLFKT